MREVSAMMVMLFVIAGGDKNFDFLSNQFAARVPEDGFGLLIHLNNRALTVDGYDGIRNRF